MNAGGLADVGSNAMDIQCSIHKLGARMKLLGRSDRALPIAQVPDSDLVGLPNLTLYWIEELSVSLVKDDAAINTIARTWRPED